MEASKYAKLAEIKAKLPESICKQFEAHMEVFIPIATEAKHGDEWIISKDDPVKSFKMWTKKDPVWVTLLSEITINQPIDKVIATFSNKDDRLKFDPMLSHIDLIKKETDNCELLRTQIKSKMMVISARDFVVYKVCGWIDDNVRYL